MEHSRSHAEALRRAGLRATEQRLAVMDALADRDDSVSAQDLHHELRRRGSAPGLATVYRTLASLAEAGELDTFSREGGEQAFKRCGPVHHHHLVCESCGKVEEVEAAEVESWISQVAERRGFEVTGHTVDVFGTCRACTATVGR